MKSIFITLFCITTLQMLSQTFRPIEWKSDNVIWSTYSIVPEIETQVISPRMWFHNNNLPLFDGGYIYNLANLFSDQGFHGYYVQKIDFKTGQEIWQNSRYFKFTDNPKPDREYASSPFVKDGSLAFYVMKEFSAFKYFFWGRGTLGKAKYDIVDGDSLSYELTNPTDTLNKILFPGIPGFGRDVFLFEHGDNTNYIVINRLCPLNCELLNLASYTLNAEGHAIDSTINAISMGRSIERVQTYKLTENKLLLVVQCPATQAGEKDIVKMMVVDYEMNIEIDIDIADHLPSRKELRSLSLFENALAGDKFNLHAQYIDSSLVIFNFDLKGNLLEEISIPPENDSEINLQSIYSLPMQTGSGSVVCISEQKTEETSFKIYKSDGVGNLILKEDLKTMDPTDSYRISYLFWTPDNNLLLHIKQIDTKQLLEYVKMDWLSNVLLDTRKMGIISTTDDVFANNQLKVYPNPSSSYIQIQGLQEEANVIIQNIDGQVIRKLITKGSEVDIRDLPNGVYIFDIQNSNVNEKHKVVKI